MAVIHAFELLFFSHQHVHPVGPESSHLQIVTPLNHVFIAVDRWERVSRSGK